ncbi:MAG: XdhC family protein [Actinobacteria bacterium]|nr:XdhC family protein [Actinomycetota bacterium]
MGLVHTEREELLRAVEAEVGAGRPFALATIVGTSGSTYRRAGARLLVTADGTWLGNLSGGCLEGEVIDVGLRVIDRDEAELAAYDLSADEEAIWGWGMGCNGAIDVLVEPARTAVEAAEGLREAERSGRPHVLASVVSSPDVAPGTHLLVREDGTVSGGLPETLAAAVTEASLTALSSGASTRVDVDGTDVFLEVVRPPLRLVVCGAGHDAVPLVRAAGALGWAVTVVDDRSSFLTPERFPGAAGLVRAEPADAATAVGADDDTFVVVMSHNFVRDVDYLGSFLGTGCAYLGVLGPGRRLERLLDELATRGATPTAEDRERLHGPAGLDLGAEGPDEIAAAICAEVLAVRRGHGGGFLRDRGGAIHRRGAGA